MACERVWYMVAQEYAQCWFYSQHHVSRVCMEYAFYGANRVRRD